MSSFQFAIFIASFFLFAVAVLSSLHVISERLTSVLKQQHNLLEKENLLIMTVAQLKALIADDTLIINTVASEVLEVKAIVSGNVGATPAQLDEIGDAVTASRGRTVTAIQSISDQVAGTTPNPQP